MKKLIFVVLLLGFISCKKDYKEPTPTTIDVQYRLVHYDKDGDSTVSKIVLVREMSQ